MFFAETLGPAITRRIGAASDEELRDIVTDFIHAQHLMLKPDAAIQYLAINGRLSRQDGATYRLAA